jgi:hypothetical protein
VAYAVEAAGGHGKGGQEAFMGLKDLPMRIPDTDQLVFAGTVDTTLTQGRMTTMNGRLAGQILHAAVKPNRQTSLR